MKYMKLFAVLLVAALMVVAGCGDSKVTPPKDPNMSNEPGEPTIPAEMAEGTEVDPGEASEEDGDDAGDDED